MAITLRPIHYININTFYSLEEWEIVGGSATTVYFVLMSENPFGFGRYIPAAGSAVSLEWIRSRAASINHVSETITRPAIEVAPTDDRSIFRVDLTADDTSKIASGGVMLKITENGVTKTYPIPFIISKVCGQPGF